MITVKGAGLPYRAVISNGQAIAYTDVAAAEGGQVSELSPSEMICAGYAACAQITTRMVLDRKQLPYDDVQVTASADWDGEKTVISYQIRIISGISEETKREIIEKVTRCPVRRMLSGEIVFEEKILEE
jgi:putative redox protein